MRLRPKLVWLAIFTAAVSFACAGTSMVRQGHTPRTTGNSFTPVTLQQTDLVAGGKCVAKLTYDRESGVLKSVETDPPCVAGNGPLRVNGQELQDISGPLTFGSGTTTCYPTSYGWKCVCTASPCP